MNCVDADVAELSKRIRELGTSSVYCWLFAVKEILLLDTLKVTVAVPLPMLPGSNELLNQIYLPVGIELELKLDVIELLITQLSVATGFTATVTFCVRLHPLAVSVYT